VLLRQILRCSFAVLKYSSVRYSTLPCITSKCVWCVILCNWLVIGINHSISISLCHVNLYRNNLQINLLVSTNSSWLKLVNPST
jgi:hypothetical protein